MDEKIVVNIRNDGSIKAETFGFTGQACVSEVDKLMKDIAKTRQIKKKTEYFQERLKIDNVNKVKRQ